MWTAEYATQIHPWSHPAHVDPLCLHTPICRLHLLLFLAWFVPIVTLFQNSVSSCANAWSKTMQEHDLQFKSWSSLRYQTRTPSWPQNRPPRLHVHAAFISGLPFKPGYRCAQIPTQSSRPPLSPGPMP
jgi:hypothetical protein